MFQLEGRIKNLIFGVKGLKLTVAYKFLAQHLGFSAQPLHCLELQKQTWICMASNMKAFT